MSDYSIVLATGNAHKVDELFAILSPLLPNLAADNIGTLRDFEVDEPLEDAPDFAGNALIKARALSTATDLPCVADDSGLCVDILGGAPGIFSARWCGRHGDDNANLNLLLAQLADVPAAYRGARFTCAAALVTPSGNERVEVGHMVGSLITSPRGSGGFGYDPIFVAEGQNLTNAELSATEKNSISHRAKAFTALTPAIVDALRD